MAIAPCMLGIVLSDLKDLTQETIRIGRTSTLLRMSYLIAGVEISWQMLRGSTSGSTKAGQFIWREEYFYPMPWLLHICLTNGYQILAAMWDMPMYHFPFHRWANMYKTSHGEPYRHFSAIIGWKALTDSIERFGVDHEFTKLVTDLKGKDPDDAFSSIPYEKGFNFIFYLEQLIGQEKFDKFIPYVRMSALKPMDIRSCC